MKCIFNFASKYVIRKVQNEQGIEKNRPHHLQVRGDVNFIDEITNRQFKYNVQLQNTYIITVAMEMQQ